MIRKVISKAILVLASAGKHLPVSDAPLSISIDLIIFAIVLLASGIIGAIGSSVFTHKFNIRLSNSISETMAVYASRAVFGCFGFIIIMIAALTAISGIGYFIKSAAPALIH